MGMRTVLLLAVCASSVFGQAQTIDVRASAEYRSARGETKETAARLAFAAAKYSALREAALRLQSAPEIKMVPLRANQLEAFLPGVVEVQQELSQSNDLPGGASYRAGVSFHLTLSQIARHLDQLRKDP